MSSILEGMKTNGLGWGVYLGQSGGMNSSGQWVEDKTGQAVFRDDNHTIVGQVGNQYETFSNPAAGEFLDRLFPAGMAEFHSARALKGGRKIMVRATFPGRNFEAAVGDVVSAGAVMTFAHDGSGSIKPSVFLERLVCTNGMRRPVNIAEWTVSHHASAGERLDRLSVSIRAILADVDNAQAEVAAMVNRKMTKVEVGEYFSGIFPAPKKEEIKPAAAIVPVNESALLDSILAGKSDRQSVVSDLLVGNVESQSRTERNNAKLLDQLMVNWDNGKQTLPGIEHTAWAAYNSVSEYTDHQMGTRGRSDSDREENRLTSQLWGQGDRIKQTAWTNALSLAR